MSRFRQEPMAWNWSKRDEVYQSFLMEKWHVGLVSLQKCDWLESGRNQSDKYAASCRYSWICLGVSKWSRWSSDVSSSSSTPCVCLNFICFLKTFSGIFDQVSLWLLWGCMFLGKEGSNMGEGRECWAGLLPAGQPNSSFGTSSKASCHPPSRQKKRFWPEAKHSKLRQTMKRELCAWRTIRVVLQFGREK